MSRIQLSDTPQGAIVKMAEGNPGAVAAMIDILGHGEAIDPQGFMGGFGGILSLDTHGIYGTDIYILYNDKCNRDARRTLMIMRAVQLGFFSEHRLQEMAHDQTYSVNLTGDEWADLDSQVCSRLDQFQRPETEAEGEALSLDANREMIGDEADFDLGDIGDK